MAEWIFTFGPDHTHPDTGESLGGRYVRLDADDEMAARVRMFALFGRGWSSVYPIERGLELIAQYGWTPLFLANSIFPSVQPYHLDAAMRMLDDMTRDDLPADLRDALMFVLSRDRATVEKERIQARDAFLRMLPPLQDSRLPDPPASYGYGYWNKPPEFGALPPVQNDPPLIGERRLDFELDTLKPWPQFPPLYTGQPELPLDVDEEATSELAADWAEADERERREADAEDGPEYDEGDGEFDDPREMTEADNGDHG